MKKNTCRYYFTHVYHKWQSYDAWFLRYEAWQTEYFFILDRFCPFTPLTTWKIKILKKWKQHLEISFHTCVPKMIIIWCMVPEIWSMRDKIFCHSGPFFALLPPLTTWKNQSFGKMRKMPGDVIILHKHSKNHDQMLYYSLDMALNRYNCYFSFGLLFVPITYLTARKIKIF